MILVAEKSWWEIWKEKKAIYIGSWYVNHPNRFGYLRLSGSITHDDDRRVTAGPADLAATRRVFDVDFSLLPTWERVFFENLPVISEPSISAEGQFKAAGRLSTPLSVSQFTGSVPASVVIGTQTVYEYSRPTGSDPWTLDTTTPTDYSLAWSPRVAGGSFVANTNITAFPSSGPTVPTSSSIIRDVIYNTTFTRAPLDEPWASESTFYSDIFDDELAALNTADGGGHTGSCTLTFHFTP